MLGSRGVGREAGRSENARHQDNTEAIIMPRRPLRLCQTAPTQPRWRTTSSWSRPRRASMGSGTASMLIVSSFVDQ